MNAHSFATPGPTGEYGLELAGPDEVEAILAKIHDIVGGQDIRRGPVAVDSYGTKDENSVRQQTVRDRGRNSFVTLSEEPAVYDDETEIIANIAMISILDKEGVRVHYLVETPRDYGEMILTKYSHTHGAAGRSPASADRAQERKLGLHRATMDDFQQAMSELGRYSLDFSSTAN